MIAILDGVEELIKELGEPARHLLRASFNVAYELGAIHGKIEFKKEQFETIETN